MKRKLLLGLLFLACCCAGFFAAWLTRDVLGGWTAPVALGWAVVVSKAFAVGLAVSAGADR